MPPFNSNRRGADDLAAHGTGRTTLFKDDRPRHIDRYISFFGDTEQGRAAEASREEARTDRWGDW